MIKPETGDGATERRMEFQVMYFRFVIFKMLTRVQSTVSKMSNGSEHDGPRGDVSPDYTLEQIFLTLDRRHRRFSDAMHRTSSQRMEMYHHIVNLQYSMSRLQDSVSSLVNKDGAVKPKASHDRPRTRLKKLRSSVHLDAEELGTRIENLLALTTEVQSTERALGEAERSFDNARQVMSSALRRQNILDFDDSQPDVALIPTLSQSYSSCSVVASATATELKTYYTAVGRLKNMRERLSDLQIEKEEQWDRRMLLEDQGQFLEQTEEEFNLAWGGTLESAIAAFQEAHSTVKEARKVCVEAGVTIPSWAEVDSVGDELDTEQQGALLQVHSHPEGAPSSVLPSADRIEQRCATTALPLPHDQETPASTSPVHHAFNDERVARWIQEIELQSVEVNHFEPMDPEPDSAGSQGYQEASNE